MVLLKLSVRSILPDRKHRLFVTWALFVLYDLTHSHHCIYIIPLYCIDLEKPTSLSLRAFLSRDLVADVTNPQSSNYAFDDCFSPMAIGETFFGYIYRVRDQFIFFLPSTLHFRPDGSQAKSLENWAWC